MTPLLQIVIALVLLVLCGVLVPLLLQLRRTARSVQELAESARQDLNVIATDLHHVRGRLDQLADLAASSMALPATLGDLMGSLSRSIPDLLGRQASGWIGIVIAGLKFAMDQFLRPKQRRPEPEPEAEATDLP